MRPPKAAGGAQTPRQFLWDLLTFDRLLTGPVVHLIYWAGLAVIMLGGFSVVGGAIGLAVKGISEGSFLNVLLAIPILIAGLLIGGAMALLWRGFCEFYVAIFRISEDLRALRERDDAATGAQPKLRSQEGSLF